MTLPQIRTETIRLLNRKRMFVDAAQRHFESFQKLENMTIDQGAVGDFPVSMAHIEQRLCQWFMKQAFEVERELARFQEWADTHFCEDTMQIMGPDLVK